MRSTPARCFPQAAAIVAAGGAAYATSFWGSFQFDDLPAIRDNPTVRQLWPLRVPLSPPAGALTVSGRPILNLSFALNHALSGYEVWSYHALNLAIHLAAALTLFGILRRTWTNAAWPAAAAAILWVAHPLTTESVTYIVQRAESLAALFYLLTVYFFIRNVSPSSPTSSGGLVAEAARAFGTRPRTEPESLGRFRYQSPRGGWIGERNRWLSLSVFCCALGIATKEIVVSAPLAVLFYDRAFVTRNWLEIGRKRWAYYLALVATWIPLAVLVAHSGWDRGKTAGFHTGVSWTSYWLSQGEAAARYAGLVFWPHPLALDYGASTAPIPLKAILCALVIAAGVTTLIGSLRGKAWAFPTTVCYLILAPTSLIPGVLQFMAEHRMYLPLAALLALAVAAARAAARHWVASDRSRRLLLTIAVIALPLALAAASVRRNWDYRDDLTLWLANVAKRPQSGLANANVGFALLTRQRIAEAIPYCQTAVRLDPLKPQAHYNLGMAYEARDRRDEALAEFAAAAKINPRLAYAEFRAGRLLDSLGRPAEAEAYLRQSVAVDPTLADAHGSLGVALAALNRPEEAIGEYQTSLRLRAGQPEVEFNLGLVLARLGRLPDALAHYQAAAALRPGYGEAELNRGVTLARLDRIKEAVPVLRTAVRLLPDSPEAHANLGAALDESDLLNEAIAEYRRAVELRPGYPEANFNLSRALRRRALQ